MRPTIDLAAIEEAIALAKRQREGGTAYSFDTVSIEDMATLVAVFKETAKYLEDGGHWHEQRIRIAKLIEGTSRL